MSDHPSIAWYEERLARLVAERDAAEARLVAVRALVTKWEAEGAYAKRRDLDPGDLATWGRVRFAAAHAKCANDLAACLDGQEDT